MRDLDVIVSDDLGALRRLVDESPDLHAIGIREIVRGRGAVRSLPDVLARGGVEVGSAVTVLSDTTRKRYKSDDVLDVVLDTLRVSYRVELVRLAPRPPAVIVHADVTTVGEAVESARRCAPKVLVSVGSGTMVDIGKVVANELSIPHVVVQTAASVNGFADDQSVLLVDGVKRTTPSGWPHALIIDPWIVAEAPIAMTRSGLGDQLSMFSAAADWYLANAVGFDTSYAATPVAIMRRDVDELVATAHGLGWSDQSAVDLLASCLTMGGLAMGVAGRTAPSSGSEHLISHLLEMYGDALGLSTASHGSQVGAASVFAGIVWHHVRERITRGDCRVDASNIADFERVRAAFIPLDPSGAMAEECWTAYQRKSKWIRLHLNDINEVLDDWTTHDVKIESLLEPPEFVAAVLRNAQAPSTFDELDPLPAPDAVVWATANCHLMRDRFTVVDLADLLGLWDFSDVNQWLAQQRAMAK